MFDISEVTEIIEGANDHAMTQIIQAVIRRYKVVYPDQEVIFLSLPLGAPEERRMILRHAMEALGLEEG